MRILTDFKWQQSKWTISVLLPYLYILQENSLWYKLCLITSIQQLLIAQSLFLIIRYYLPDQGEEDMELRQHVNMMTKTNHRCHSLSASRCWVRMKTVLCKVLLLLETPSTGEYRNIWLKKMTISRSNKK